jgi:hypothetical protein
MLQPTFSSATGPRGAVGLASCGPNHVRQEGLFAGNPDRERACWSECDLEMLRTRGQRTGLAENLDEVRTRLVPLFLHGRQGEQS